MDVTSFGNTCTQIALSILLVWLCVKILSDIDALFKYLVSETPRVKKPFEIEIKSIPDLRNRLWRCSHLTVYRKLFRYNHHLFIGNVDRSGCDIYHFKFALIPCLMLSFPAQVTKERLEYSSYSDNREIKRIFNFENGDSVIIVNRHDYPSSKDAEENCITRAESRVGEINYSIANNNCESFVNWVFSGDNTSYEYCNAHKLKKIIAIIIEAIVNSVVYKIFYEIVIYILISPFVRAWESVSSFFKQRQQEKREGHHKCQKKETDELNETFLDPSIDSDRLYSSFCHEKSRTSFCIDNKISGFESQCTNASMVCGGTRFEDDIKCYHDVYEHVKKQNYELRTNLANVAKERNYVALPCINYKDFKMQKCVNKDSTCCLGFDYGYVCGSEEEETMFSALESVKYAMQSSSVYVPETVNFLIKSYVNVKDVHMTISQVQTRVCMDSFSSLGGVYGCVYGSKLADSFSSDSEYAATIGCTTSGLIGTAGGAVLGSLACQQLT